MERLLDINNFTMSDKIKNIITNILGLIFYGLGILAYFQDKTIMYISGLLLIGSVAFLFKISETKKYFDRYINSKIS